MEEGLGVFQRLGASIDNRLGAAGATALGRAIRRITRWVIQAVVWIGVVVAVAAIGGVVGIGVYIVLRAIGLVPAIRNNATNWWAVGGAIVGALYFLGFLVWDRLRGPR